MNKREEGGGYSGTTVHHQKEKTVEEIAEGAGKYWWGSFLSKGVRCVTSGIDG